LKKKIIFVVGIVSLLLGIVGIFIPLLPTTPFLLLSAACFSRSSEKMYSWLMNHPWFGKYIREFQENKSIPLPTKVISVGMLWITIFLSVIFVTKSIHIRVLLITIAVLVSVHILRYRTSRPKCK
jgi:uncharacterized protein